MAKEDENIKLYWNHSINSTSSRTGSRYVALRKFIGRLENQIFEFATLFYVVPQTNREVGFIKWSQWSLTGKVFQFES